MTPGRARALLSLLVVALIGFGALNLRVRTDITQFLPTSEAAELGAISRLLTDSELARTLVLCVGSDDPQVTLAASRGLEEALLGHPEVAWVRSGIDPELPRHVYELYFPRRYAFLSDDPEREIPALVTDDALRRRAERARRELSLPTAVLQKRILAQDPLGAFTRILERLRGIRPALRLVDGRFVSRDDGFAVLFVGTRAAPFDAERQGALLDFVSAQVEKLSVAHGVRLDLERSGIGLFAVEAERQMRGDVVRIGVFSFVGVTVLFLLFFGSPRIFGLALLPGGIGMLAATDVLIALRGEVDGLTLAFGTSLIGVAIDYPIHLLHHRVLNPEVAAATVARRLRPSLGLGAGTTMASFAGLGLTDFPGFREIAVFAVVGIGVALAVTLWLLPALLDREISVPKRSARVAERLSRLVRAAAARRSWLVALSAGVALLVVSGLPFLQWNDDLSSLTSFDPALRAEDARVRQRVARLESGRVVLVVADGADAALERNDTVYARLAPLVASGRIEGIHSLHTLLFSPSLQRRNLETLADQPRLAERAEAAFQAAGFRAGTLEPFRESLRADPEEPLGLAGLRESVLRPLLEPLAFDLGDQTAIVTYLRGAGDLAPVRAALDGVPGVRVFEQRAFINEIFAAFRGRTLRQTALGSVLVVAVLLLRYRRWRPALAAFLPSVLTVAVLLGCFAWLGVKMHLVHVVSLLMVMGMGVDYGIFLVDSSREPRALSATLLSLLVSCCTTVFVFGSLVLSSQEALRAMGLTTGLGVLLSFVFAPVVLIVVRPGALDERR